MTTLDVVVVNYRTPADMGAFLRSYAEHPPALEGGLWVCNVQPTMADRDVVEDSRSDLKLEELVFADNVGYARSCNAGAALGTSDVVAFFNADVVLTQGALDSCAVAVDVNPAWGVLGPRQVDERGRITAGGIFGTSSAPRMRGWSERGAGMYQDVRDDAVSVAGAALFAKRQVWEELGACEDYRGAAPEAEGAFLPTQHYYEETYFCYHARHHGWRCAYYGSVTVVHKWHRASEIGSAVDRDVMRESRGHFRRACDAHGMEHD